MWDSHTHSRFSGDSDASLHQILTSAMRLGLEGLCITDHHDLDYPKADDEPDFLVDFPTYFDTLRELRETYKERIHVGIGLELGLQVQVAEANRIILQENSFDFVIGSVHTVHGQDPYYPAFFESREEKAAFEEYFAYTAENLMVFDDFDVLGHIGYLVRYAPHQNKYYHPADYADYIDVILKHLIENGKGIECNTSGYFQGLNSPIPCKEILLRYKELGGEILTIGSDAHTPDQIGRGFDRASELLTSLGYKYYTVFQERKPQFHKL